jgi:hypothetical protein
MYKNYDIKSAWKKDDFINSSWVTYLSDNQRKELYKAALSLPDNESDWLNLKKEDIKIPLLQPLLDESSIELNSGRGFVLLKNLGELISFYYRYFTNNPNTKHFGRMIASREMLKKSTGNWAITKEGTFSKKP